MGEPEQRFSSACSIPQETLVTWATMRGSCAHPDQSPLLALAALESKTISGSEHPPLFYPFSSRVV